MRALREAAATVAAGRWPALAGSHTSGRDSVAARETGDVADNERLTTDQPPRRAVDCELDHAHGEAASRSRRGKGQRERQDVARVQLEMGNRGRMIENAVDAMADLLETAKVV